jgi:predicted O-linked N-acetylglucosamine transferase (SPINDLY family)
MVHIFKRSYLRQFQAVTTQPKSPQMESTEKAKALFFEGLESLTNNDYNAAEKLFKKAHEIMPERVSILINLSAVLIKQHKLDEAKEVAIQTLTIENNCAEAWLNLGLIAKEESNNKEAFDCYEKAIEIKPDYIEALHNKGSLSQATKKHHIAIECYQQILQLQPNHNSIRSILHRAKREICDWKDYYLHTHQLITRINKGMEISSPFSTLSLTTSPEIQLKTAHIFARTECPSRPELPHISNKRPADKIRIGYFSADFKNHPLMHLMARFFELHDKNSFETTAFSLGHDTNDEMRKRAKIIFDRFLDVRKLSDIEVARQARQWKIDIAVDLTGYTRGNRPGIFQHRAAPIQISYLGFPGTMGTDFIDYIVADSVVIPPQNQSYYSEKIIRLPHTYWCNDNTREISPKLFSRKELKLPDTGFVFCCFNNSQKITPSTYDSWMRILTQTPGSVLWLLKSNELASENLKVEAEKRGVNKDRIIFADKMPIEEHLARHKAADLFIDTLPYNAHTTAADALWASLPVLTYTDDSFAFASRVAASLLTAIQLPELITFSREEFEARAVELAKNPERLQQIKYKLNHNRLSTPLFDTSQFTQHFENAYREIYNRFQNGLQPVNIEINDLSL